MIKVLDNNDLEIALQIRDLFQLSYAVEAALLEVSDFPPLKRPLESYRMSSNDFLGYFENDELAGVIEIEQTKTFIDINSLVVHPKFFRRGIGRKLIAFTFEQFDHIKFLVETGIKNTPAIALYQTMGFTEMEQWDTDFGVRKIRLERRITP